MLKNTLKKKDKIILYNFMHNTNCIIFLNINKVSVAVSLL